jgi:outer membrane protein assembly factor BamB
MDNYISHIEGGENIGFGISPEFGELHAVAGLLEAKETRASLIEGIGVGGSILSFPKVHKDRVYFGCCDKNVYCIDLEGKEVWRFPTSDVVLSSALIHKDVIYIGSYDGSLYALDMRGKLLWKFSTNGKIIIRASAHDNHIYFGSTDNNLYKIDLNGRLVWKFTANGRVIGETVFHGNKVLFPSGDHNFYAVDVKTGKEEWRYTTGGYTTAFPAFILDKKVCFGSEDMHLYALNLDGTLAWKYKTKDTVYPAGIYKNMTFAASRDGNLYAIDIRTGKEVWIFKTRDIVATHVANDNDKLYFGSWDKNLYCIDAKGKLIWKFPTSGFIASTPTIHNGVVYFGCWDCKLYAINAQTGDLVWTFPTSLSYQSSIQPAESRKSISVEINVQEEENKEEKNKYESGEGTGYDINMSQYGAMDISYISESQKKKGYKTA